MLDLLMKCEKLPRVARKVWRFARIAWAGYNFSTQGISQPPSEEVAHQYHASYIKMLSWWLEGNTKKMKNYFVLLFALITSTVYAQYGGFKRFKPMNGTADAKLVYRADELAYKKACNDSIYTKEVMQSYLDYKNARIEDYDKDKRIRQVFERVIKKGKELKDEDKNWWRQVYYDFEYQRLFSQFTQEEKEKAAQQDYMRRHDWSKSDILYSLKEYCKHDFSLSDPTILDQLAKYNIDDYREMAKNYMGNEGFNFNSGRFLSLPSEDDEKETYANEEEERWGHLQDFQNLHIALKRLLENKTMEELYRIVLKNIGYSPSIPEAKVSLGAYDALETKALAALYQKDKNDENVRELENLFAQWKDITSACAWEKQLLSESKGLKTKLAELREALAYREQHPLASGVLNDEGQSIPYIADGNKLVVNGTCILKYKDEQFPKATGDWYKKYTVDLKLSVKVEHGKAVSMSISGVQKWWDEDQRAFKNAKGGLMQKAAAMMDAKPVVTKTHNVTKVEDLGFGPEMGIMLRDLQYVLGYAATEKVGERIENLCKDYLERPSNDILKQIKMPFSQVDISAIK